MSKLKSKHALNAALNPYLVAPEPSHQPIKTCFTGPSRHNRHMFCDCEGNILHPLAEGVVGEALVPSGYLPIPSDTHVGMPNLTMAEYQQGNHWLSKQVEVLDYLNVGGAHIPDHLWPVFRELTARVFPSFTFHDRCHVGEVTPEGIRHGLWSIERLGVTTSYFGVLTWKRSEVGITCLLVQPRLREICHISCAELRACKDYVSKPGQCEFHGGPDPNDFSAVTMAERRVQKAHKDLAEAEFALAMAKADAFREQVPLLVGDGIERVRFDKAITTASQDDLILHPRWMA